VIDVTETEVRYARSGDVHVAFRAAGEGSFDVVLIPADPLRQAWHRGAVIDAAGRAQTAERRLK
jgi:hypothetical protein